MKYNTNNLGKLATNYQELRIQNVAVLHRSQTISTQQASGHQDLLGDVFVFKLLPGLYTCTLKVSETKAGKAAHVIRRYMCNRKGRDMANLGTHSSLIDFPNNPEDTSLPAASLHCSILKKSNPLAVSEPSIHAPIQTPKQGNTQEKWGV